MARIRTVKPEFFKHYDLYKAEKETGLPLRLAFQGLWVVADKEGRFKFLPQQLKLDVLPYDEVDFESVLVALDKYGFIEIYEVSGKKYAHIPTFTEHQRITGTERDTESKIPKKQQGNTIETPSAETGNNSDDRKGKEGKGREGKGVEPPSDKFKLEGVIWDIEKWLLEHEKHFETVCIQSCKGKEEVLLVLKKFHLWNVNNEKYPKKPLPLIAGLQGWLLNEKKNINGTGTNQQQSGKNNPKTAGASKLLNSLKDDIRAGGTSDYRS